MSIVHPCSSDGCNTLTMGELCLDCERALLDSVPTGDDEDRLVEEEAVPVT